ncbi:MAG: transglycosylase SLT domain-containing protein, partial [Alphaproteobacteria bacterium]
MSAKTRHCVLFLASFNAALLLAMPSAGASATPIAADAPTLASANKPGGANPVWRNEINLAAAQPAKPKHQPRPRPQSEAGAANMVPAAGAAEPIVQEVPIPDTATKSDRDPLSVVVDPDLPVAEENTTVTGSAQDEPDADSDTAIAPAEADNAAPPGTDSAQVETTGAGNDDATASANAEQPANTAPEAVPVTATLELPPGDPNAPRPKPRPDPGDIAKELAKAAQRVRYKRPPYGFAAAPALKGALDAIGRDNYRDAAARLRQLSDPMDRRLVEWFMARAPDSGVDHNYILAVQKDTPGWPEPERLQLRAELAILRKPYSDAEYVAFFRDTAPMTLTGRLAAARRLVLRGEKAAATGKIRRIWREDTFSSKSAIRLAKEFKFALRPADHRYRLHRLIYKRQTNAALTQADLTGSNYRSLVKAVIPALRRRRQSARLLNSVSPTLRDDPAYQLAKIRILRRNKRPVAAAQLLFHTSRDPDVLADPDAWWAERRDLSRQLIDIDQPALAYRVAAEHSAQSEKHRVEAEFHAGWYALRFLDKPQTAKVHFQRVAGLADLPRTISRAHYWLGQAHSAGGNTQAAALSHRIAARHGATFYGQLSRDILDLTGTGQETGPPITARDRLTFTANPLARAIRRLAAAGHGNRTRVFFRAMAASSDTPGELALAAVLARRINQPRAILHIAAIASRRGLDIGALNAPLIGIPANVPVPKSISKAMLYAVSRQESAFNPGAISHAGARGLMQLMPATARATARSIGYGYSASRLTSDPAYNATLGAAHLAALMKQLDCSYIMTFAG